MASFGWILPEVWFVSMILSCAAVLVGSLVACSLFDRLLRLEHDRYRTEWVRDGAPIGFFWVPPGTSVLPLSGNFKRDFVALKWLLRTPGWATQDSTAKLLLFRWRIAHAVYAIALLILLLAWSLPA